MTYKLDKIINIDRGFNIRIKFDDCYSDLVNF